MAESLRRSDPKSKAADVIPPELEDENPIAEEIANFVDDPYGTEEPDGWGLGNSWDWAGGN